MNGKAIHNQESETGRDEAHNDHGDNGQFLIFGHRRPVYRRKGWEAMNNTNFNDRREGVGWHLPKDIQGRLPVASFNA